jgi:hypothetical protein
MATIRKITIALALISIGRFLFVSALQVVYPVDLLFESATWNTALLLHQGVNIYSPNTYDAPPFNLNMYTPLYFAIVSSLPGFASAPLMIGRTVSLIFACGALALLVGTAESKQRMQIGVIGIGWLLLFQPLLINGTFFRMEFMALFFSACAIASIRKNDLRAGDAALATLFSFLAVMSKQSYIAAPLACSIYLLWRAPKQALRFAALFSLLLGICFYVIDRWSGGGFLWSILVAPRNPMSLDWFVVNMASIQTPSFFTLLILSSVVCFALMQPAGNGRLQPTPAHLNVIYFLISWGWLLASIGKVGANPNYFIEPLYASVWLLLTWIDRRPETWMEGWKSRYALMLLPLVLASDAFITRKEPYYLFPTGIHRLEDFQKIKGEMERLNIPPKPKILNLINPFHSLSVGWDLNLNDPFLYSLLWDTGALSNRSMLDAIDQNYFDLIVLRKGAGRRRLPPGPNPSFQVLRKIFERYELKAEDTYAYYGRRTGPGQP